MNISANEKNAIEFVSLGLIKILLNIIESGFFLFQRYSCFILTNLAANGFSFLSFLFIKIMIIVINNK